ncbi:MAG: pvadh, partial [Acidimicrobiales bacterium]|nr:pvadh [Acidimicrobiales bacterium]
MTILGKRLLAVSLIGFGLLSSAAIAQPPASADTAVGEALFKERCAACHDPATDRAPSRQQLGPRWPDEVANALKTGVMQPMASGLSEAQIAAIANYVTGGQPAGGRPQAQVDPPKCAVSPPFSMKGSNWNGWGVDNRNHRYQVNGGLKAAD